MAMSVTVKKIALWRKEIENRPGALAAVLAPLAEAGTDLQVVMGYRHPGHESQATVEVSPVSGKKATKVAQDAGLGASSIPTLLVEGDNQPGLGAAISQSLAEAGINVSFLVAQVIGGRFSAVVGFDTPEDAAQSSAVIKKAARLKGG
jgi:hypothetical protein